MPLGYVFWLLMILALVFNLWFLWPLGVASGSTLFIFVLLALLGWKVFGPVVNN